MKLISTTLFALTGMLFISQAQNTSLPNSGKLIQEAIHLYDSGQYKKAMALYQQVNRSDTNYVWALYEKALCAEADSQYNQGIKYCEEGLALKTEREHEPELYNEYGNLLNDIGQNEKALTIFDTALRKYPAYSLLYFNKGTVLLAMNRFSEAEELFRQTLLINPYLYSAHYQLAIAALRQGKIIPSFLSFTGYLLMNPQGKYNSRCIKLLDAIARSKDDIIEYKKKRANAADDNYNLIEEIVLSRIALEKEYKPLTALDDAISRQVQVVFEKLEYTESTNDFWIQYYLPFYKRIFSEGRFEVFINHILSDVNLAVIQDYTRKNKKAIQELINDAAVYFNKVRSTRELTYAKRDHTIIKYLIEDGDITGKGKLVNEGKTFAGQWDFYYPAGNLKAAGLFNETGKKEGKWKYYYYNGNLRGQEYYKNGKLQGEQEFYFENGLVSSHEYYIDGNEEGLSTSYYYAGNVRSTATYKSGKLEGEKKDFYSNGSIHYINNYTNGIRNGSSTAYHTNGKLKEISQYNQDVLQGPYKAYYDNGILSTEGQFVKDNVEGEWENYYENGRLKNKRHYINGKQEGAYEEYHDNGRLWTAYAYKKGKVTGEALYYDKDGKLYIKHLYDNDALVSGKYFDKSGNQISTSEMKNKSIDIISYNPDGSKKSHHVYDDKGYTIGTETFFYPSGKISGTDEYRDGVLNGPSVTYYCNGSKKTELDMVDGKKDGRYKEYYSNGQIETEGWYKEDQAQGEWIYYDESGNITTKSYYLDEDLDGYREEYTAGKKTLEQKYHRGWLEEMIQYDSTGKELIHDFFPKESGKYLLIYPNGKKMVEAEYDKGDFDGPYTTYYFDGSVENIQFFKKGMKDSSFIDFNYGGGKHSEGQFSLGKKTGTWKFYYDDGRLSYTQEYSNDQLNGKRIDFFENGHKDTESWNKDNEIDSLLYKYDPDDSLLYQLRFDNGDPIAYAYRDNNGRIIPEIPIVHGSGKLKAFFSNGKPSREWEYAEGKLHGRDILYYSNGLVRSVGNNEYGISTGPWKTYFPNGKIKADYYYVLGNVNGPGKEYNDKGVLIREYYFLNGSFHGPAKYYDDNGKLIETREYYYGKLLSVKK